MLATWKWQRTKSGGPESRLWAAGAGRGQGEPHAANASTWKHCQSAAKQDAKRRGTERPGRRRIMQAGRWTDARMPMRYGERALTSRGAMAPRGQESGASLNSRRQGSRRGVAGRFPNKAPEGESGSRAWRVGLAAAGRGQDSPNGTADEEYWKDTRMPMRCGEKILAGRGRWRRGKVSGARLRAWE